MIPSGIITITSDFGESDPYVAVMKGVILSINPGVRIVGNTQHVPSGSILEGGAIIGEAYKYFPSGTIHLAVVDPGVGGKRRPIAVLAHNHFFVGPDNGLFWPAIETDQQAAVIHLTNRHHWMQSVSPTFHGRDIFAPVASHLSRGVNPFLLGERIDNPTAITYPLPVEKKGELRGEVIRVDHFGNLNTNITADHHCPVLNTKDLTITAGKLVLRKLSTIYSDVPEGAPLALIGSSRALEIAVNLGRAADALGRERAIGTSVIVRMKGEP